MLDMISGLRFLADYIRLKSMVSEGVFEDSSANFGNPEENQGGAGWGATKF